MRVHQNILTEGSLPIWMRRTYPALWAHPLGVGVARWKRRWTYVTTVGLQLQPKKTPLRLVASSLAFSVGETHLKDRNWVGEPFEIERSLGVEIEALPNTEITHCCRNGDAAWRGHSAKSCRQLDRRPE